MELRDIEYFSVVARHGHLGRAGEELGLSQSALSKSMRRLENAIGAKLIRGTPKGVVLTAEGETLLSHVHRLRTSLDDIVREVSDVRRGLSGHLRIGVGAGYFFHVVPAACNALVKSAPAATLRLREFGPADSIHALRSGELDIAIRAIGSSLGEDLEQQHLYDDRFAVISAPTHRLAKRKSLKLAELAQERWILSSPTSAISRQWHGVFERYGIPSPQVAIETNSPVARLAGVAGTDLLGYTMASVARRIVSHDEVAVLNVKELSLTFSVGVVYRRNAYLSPLARRYIGHLKSAAEHMIQRLDDGEGAQKG